MRDVVLPLDLAVLGIGAPDIQTLLQRVKILAQRQQEPILAAKEAAQEPLRASPVRVALYAEDQAALQKSLALLQQILEKGGSPARLEAQGIYLREDPPLSQEQVAFMFPGQGSQYVGMMDELRAKYPLIESTLQEADTIMEKVLPKHLSSYMKKLPEQDEMEAFFTLSQTEILQPAILASDEAIRRLLSSLVSPKLVFGHSLGEYGACVAAGVMPFADALRVVAAREGALAKVEIKDNGKMLAVGTNEETMSRLLKDVSGYVVVVNKNCPSQTIIGGETAAVEAAEIKLKAAGIEGVYLPVSHAFHSQIVGPGSVPLLEELRKISISSPKTPILSNVTAELYQSDPEWIRVTLAKQMASPVEFIKMVEHAYSLGVRVFVEVGPKRAQSGFIADILKGRPHRSIFVCHPKQGEITSLGRAIAALCADGVIPYGAIERPKAPEELRQSKPRDILPQKKQEAPVKEQRLSAPLPAPFFIRQLRLEEAPPRAPLPFTQEESRTCILYSTETEHLLSLFSGVPIEASLDMNEAKIKELLGGASCEVIIDLCLFGEQPVQDVLGAALFQTKRVLRIAKLFHSQRPKRVVVYTPLGGGFGVPDESFEAPTDAVLSGVGAAVGAWKSAIREWHGEGLPWYPLSIIDLPSNPSNALWQEAKKELTCSSSFEIGLLETSLGVVRRAPKYAVGYLNSGAVPVGVGTVDTKPAVAGLLGGATVERGPAPDLQKGRTPLYSLGLKSQVHGRVIALFGGGRGITAKIATQLAAEGGYKLALFGRTQSQPEIPAFDRARALFAAKEQLGPSASRSQLQKRAEELLRQKELAATLTQLKELGAEFFYQQGDIRFANQVKNFLEETERRLGPIDTIIYGAGIDRSRGLQNKSETEVEEVLATFLQSEIIRFCREKRSKLVVLGSLSSRYGNFGQLDYGAAHESLAKVARSIPSSLVLDFTAWSDIGMAAPLASTFKERGIDLLPPQLGAQVAVEALRQDLSGEWVISGKVPQPNVGGKLLRGHAEFFIPWVELRQHANVADELLHPAFMIEAAREAAQSIFLPVPIASMRVSQLKPGANQELSVIATQERQTLQEVCCQVRVLQQENTIFACTTNTKERAEKSIQPSEEGKALSAKAKPLIARAWTSSNKLSARSVVLPARENISAHTMARVFLLQAAELRGRSVNALQRIDEVLFLRELSTPTAIATIEESKTNELSLYLHDANGVLCESWRGALYVS